MPRTCTARLALSGGITKPRPLPWQPRCILKALTLGVGEGDCVVVVVPPPPPHRDMLVSDMLVSDRSKLRLCIVTRALSGLSPANDDVVHVKALCRLELACIKLLLPLDISRDLGGLLDSGDRSSYPDDVEFVTAILLWVLRCVCSAWTVKMYITSIISSGK